MPALDDSLSDSKTYRAWAGSTADLLPVLEAVVRQYRDLRAAAIREDMRHPLLMRDLKVQNLDLAESIAERRRGQDGTLAPDVAESVRRAQEALENEDDRVTAARVEAEAADNISVEIVTRRGAERSTKGTPEQIVEYLGQKDIRELSLSAPAGNIQGHRVYIKFDRMDGVRLSVRSSDSRWAVSALGEVGETLERKVPTWAWLRGSIFLALFFYAAGVAVAYLLLPEPPEDLDTASSLSLGLLRGVVIALVGSVGTFGTRRFVPAFELLPAGGKARVDRIVLALAGGVATIGLGLVVNLIS